MPDTRTTVDRIDRNIRAAAEARRLAQFAGEWADVEWFTEQIDCMLDRRLKETRCSTPCS